MAREISIRISGEAGRGMHTVGMALSRAAARAGFSVFASQDYMSRVRGGHNFLQVRISTGPVLASLSRPDLTVALDDSGGGFPSGGLVVLDREKFSAPDSPTLLHAPLYRLAGATGRDERFVNSVACGLAAGLTGLPFPLVEEVLREMFGGKGEEIVAGNAAAARAGHGFANELPPRAELRLPPPPPGKTRPLIMNGNEAIALGAIRAGCSFYTAYPMTPSTSIMNEIARHAARFAIVVEQAEDEIAAINMAIGASYAGVRSMTATSGGGFCLMVEGISLAAMTETPVVLVDAQRPGPATGFPTRTEQADLDFVLHAGHGEFARAVFAPGTIEETFAVTVRAFDLAERFQMPVIILTDQHLADSYLAIPPFDTAGHRTPRRVISKEDSGAIRGYARYRLTPDGVSPRAIPSWIEEPVYADSDEHTEEGHITEDAGIRSAMVRKRLYLKREGLSRETLPPVGHRMEGARTVLVGFGSTFGAIREAADALADAGVGALHLPQLAPFPAEAFAAAVRGAGRVITVENNAGAQLAGLIRRETGIAVHGSVLKFDGRPFCTDELVGRVEAELQKGES